MIKLVGMMDSPYVRRVAISLELYGVEFESQPLSVFSTFDAFSRINPAVKAPTLILDNGIRLMDSSLILNYFEAQATPERRLSARRAGCAGKRYSDAGFYPRRRRESRAKCV